MKTLLLTVGLVLGSVGSPGYARAAAEPEVEDLPQITITDPNRDLFRLALPTAVGETALAAMATDIERRDLDLVGLFRVLNPESFPDSLIKEGLGFSSDLWSQVGAQGVAKLRATRDAGRVLLEGRLYQIGRGESPVLTKTYRGAELRPLVHQWANDVIAQFTGLRGVFGSRIAFAMTGRTAEIATIGMDGQEMKVVTQMKSECLLPAMSPSGGQIAFNSFLRGGADLWVVSARGGRARRISARPGMNTGPAWLRSDTLVATLSYDGNPDLYKLSATDGKIITRLTRSPAADLSASLSPGGAQIAFVSDRQGTPQIYLMSAAGGGAKRLTFQGSYNQTPRFCPRKETPLIAFTGRDERGVFDVFLYDLRTGKIDRVTQGQGSNYDPAWSPDGRLLVYASSRGGLFVRNLQTLKEFRIYKGGARNPSWGPPPADFK
ncbi:MAG: PD40 domain-containing protein [Deltaproteobacteria bacterium]|nr:PD40 domain-containing protein [Deltaproteobacteria bacterium]